jgi:Uma2 family endonuclease
MSATTLIPVDEYLNTNYPDGDREYVDGVIVERNMGTTDHAHWQSRFLVYLSVNYPALWVAVDCRIQVKATRFRVPDVVCVKGEKPQAGVITDPPFLVVEVLSPDDRAEYMQEKIDEYLSFGIPYVWVVDPRTRRAYVYTTNGMQEAKDGILRTSDPEIALPLSEVG